MHHPAPKKFHQAAGTYSREATVQQEVCCHVAGLLPKDIGGDSILELGCGTGKLTTYLLHRFPSAKIAALDIAPGMIQQASEQIKDPRVQWIVADARNYRTDEKFPLIVSSSALHWMLPLGETLARLNRLLAREGLLVAALMVRGTLDALVKTRAAIAPDKGASVVLPDAEDVLNTFVQTGWSIKHSDLQNYAETYTSVNDLLASLRRQGVTGKTNPDAKLLSKQELKTFKQRLAAEHTRPDGSITADYKVLFIQAGKY